MHDFDAVSHVVPQRLGAKVYCCYGAYYDVGCTADCPSCKRAADATAWAAYCRAWPEAMAQERFVVRDCWVRNSSWNGILVRGDE